MIVDLNKLYDALYASFTPEEIKEILITLMKANHKEA